MADGFAVDRRALWETAQGLRNVVNDLQEFGIEETAENGRGFSGLKLKLSGADAGDSRVAGAFWEFCDHWTWGVRTLVQDGNQFAVRLGLSAGMYHDVESKTIGAIKDVVASAYGDPHMTDQEAAAASWSEDAAGITRARTPGGNMSWQQTGQAAKQQWGSTVRDMPEVEAAKYLGGGGK